MLGNQSIMEFLNPCHGVLPGDLSGGASTSDAVCLKNYEGCLILFYKEPGKTGDDPTLTLKQATDVAIGTNKALDITDYYIKQGTLTAVGTFTHTTQSAANTITNATLAESQCIIAVDIKAEMLDIANDYDCLYVTIADPGTAGQNGSLMLIPYGPKYGKDPLPSAIVD